MAVFSERNGPVTTVINDRINARNACDPETAEALTHSFLEFEADPNARVAVFWGAGGAFCGGWDLKYAATLSDSGKFQGEVVDGLAFPTSTPSEERTLSPLRLSTCDRGRQSLRGA
jgi:enoyl-CoA hydratase